MHGQVSDNSIKAKFCQYHIINMKQSKPNLLKPLHLNIFLNTIHWRTKVMLHISKDLTHLHILPKAQSSKQLLQLATSITKIQALKYGQNVLRFTRQRGLPCRLNREYLAPQIRSINNRFHSEAKLPWSNDYPLANHIATNKSCANRRDSKY